ILMKAKRLGYVVNRPKSLMRHQRIDRCEVCRKILQIAKKDELVTRRQIALMLNIDDQMCNRHLSQLKKAGFVSKVFATIRSENIIKAIQFYKNSSLPVSAIGRMFGFKNFYSVLNYQKQKGFKIERSKFLHRQLKFKREDQMTLSQ
ncbi:MAG: winged helix-turn-helix domain-containing protein, partial [Thermodesulfobacteriota bacterium]